MLHPKTNIRSPTSSKWSTEHPFLFLPSLLRNDSGAWSLIYAAGVTWCSGKNRQKAQPWLTPTIYLSLMVPGWRLSMGKGRMYSTWKLGRAEGSSANRLRWHNGTWPLKPATFWKYHYHLQNPCFFFFFSNQEIGGEGNIPRTRAANLHEVPGHALAKIFSLS